MKSQSPGTAGARARARPPCTATTMGWSLCSWKRPARAGTHSWTVCFPMGACSRKSREMGLTHRMSTISGARKLACSRILPGKGRGGPDRQSPASPASAL